MIGKPNYIPNEWTNWAQVEPYSAELGGYPVIRKDDSFQYGIFTCEEDADLFAKAKNDLLLQGLGI